MLAELALPPKPTFGENCNGCGYCCTVGPCALAQEFLHCETGPCVALEVRESRTICGLVRNPIGYLYKAAHPESTVAVLDDPADIEGGRALSAEIASALGIEQGCDADDDAESESWNRELITRQAAR